MKMRYRPDETYLAEMDLPLSMCGPNMVSLPMLYGKGDTTLIMKMT